MGRGKADTQTDIATTRKNWPKGPFFENPAYRTRWGMQPFAGNYSHDSRYARSNWLCLCLESREDESHIKSGTCKVYGDLTLKYSDLTSDENLADLFREVLARRDQLNKQTNNQQK